MPVSETPRTTVADGPGNATIASGKRAVQITASQVQPPTPLYLQTEDSLLLILSSPILGSNPGLALVLRWLRPDGEIVSIRKTIPSAGSSVQFSFTLGEGFLLSATLAGSPSAPTSPGSTFATLLVQRDTPEAQIYSWVLFADYVTISHFPSWPFGRNQLSQEGPGRLRSITGTTPAAGADISETVPNNIRWRLIMGSMTLTTSVTVANRNVALFLDDGANILYRWNTATSTPASATARYVFSSANQSGLNDGTGQMLFIPDNLFLDQNYRLRTLTGGIQVGDQWSAPQYLVQEWVNN